MPRAPLSPGQGPTGAQRQALPRTSSGASVEHALVDLVVLPTAGWIIPWHLHQHEPSGLDEGGDCGVHARRLPQAGQAPLAAYHSGVDDLGTPLEDGAGQDSRVAV